MTFPNMFTRTTGITAELKDFDLGPLVLGANLHIALSSEPRG